MSRPQSVFQRLICAGADALADQWQVPQQNRQAFRDTAVSVLSNTFASLHGGESLYAPRVTVQLREERKARICQALAAGEASASIAKRERVSKRWVNLLRAQLQRELQPGQQAGSDTP